MAAATPEMSTEPHLYVTVRDDNENEILELVKVAPEGMYIRDNGQWIEIDPDDDNARVWDLDIHDVSPDAVEAYDSMLKTDGIPTVDKIKQYIIEEEAE